jgi:Domain of unknown function (DUF4249)
MKNKTYLLLILLTMSLTSCLEEVQIPIRTESSKLVIEGGITNESPPYTVRLSYSGNQIYATDINLNLTVTGANVVIKDDTGDSTILRPSYYERGVYRTADPDFVGKVGKTYTIKINLKEGKTYLSKPEKLTTCPPLDSLYAVFEDIKNVSYPDGYQVYADFKDPANEKNYYRWSAYGYSRVGKARGGVFLDNRCDAGGFTSPPAFNFCWVPRYQTKIDLLTDVYFNGNQIRKKPVFFSPVYGSGKHLIEVSQYAISRDAYQFWKLYDEQSSRTGTIFDPLPAPIQGNVVNKDDPNDFALGYFEVAGVYRKRLIIFGRYDLSEIYLSAAPFLPVEGGCSLPFASCERPAGWSKE